MGALEAADGMLLFGISTAFVFAVIQQISSTKLRITTRWVSAVALIDETARQHFAIINNGAPTIEGA
jgi:hypothetical protein